MRKKPVLLMQQAVDSAFEVNRLSAKTRAFPRFAEVAERSCDGQAFLAVWNGADQRRGGLKQQRHAVLAVMTELVISGRREAQDPLPV